MGSISSLVKVGICYCKADGFNGICQTCSKNIKLRVNKNIKLKDYINKTR